MNISKQDERSDGSDGKDNESQHAADTNRHARDEREDVVSELEREIAARDVSSISELQAIADEVSRRRNLRPRDDFCGLSPKQMYHILYFPFASLEIVSFHEDMLVPSEVPAYALVSRLVDACGDKGLKATARGYLPAKFCRDTALTLLGEERYRKVTFGSGVRKELDYRELHVVRLAAQMAGLIRKYRGRFVRTKKCEKILSAQNSGKLYLELLKAYTQKFNWAYSDRYDDLPIIQQSFLFSLFLLHLFGDEFRDVSFYADKFLQAFPSVLDEIRETLYGTKEEEVKHCYLLRTMERFARLFGLIELDRDLSLFIGQSYKIKKSPLLEGLLSFRV